MNERTNEWLEQRMNNIWEILFADIERKNTVNIAFTGRWKNKLGHITRREDTSTFIAINSILKDPLIPETIVDVTIAHELTHYAHGFHSPLPRKYKHPHAGGVVTRELKKRGFTHQMKLEKEFLKKHWTVFVKKHTNASKNA